jgi:hypothetical protein
MFNISDFKNLISEIGIENTKKFINYCIFMYDVKSQFVASYNILGVRKRESAIAAGFELDDNGKFDSQTESILTGLNEYANWAAIAFINLTGNYEMQALTAYLELLNKFTHDAYSMNSDKDTIKSIKDTTLLIEQSFEKVFGGKETLDMKKALYAYNENKNLMLRPEQVAKALSSEIDKDIDIIKKASPYKYDTQKGNKCHEHIMKFLGSKAPQ